MLVRIPRILWIIALLLAQGCASLPPVILEEPIGPRDLTGSKSGAGTLVVYTRLEPLNGDPESPVRSAYVVHALDGAQETQVSNRARLGADPVPLALPAGRYRVLADGPMYQPVSVLVVIQPRDQTVVDLTGEVFPQRPASVGDWVRLPSGAVVGPRARVE